MRYNGDATVHGLFEQRVRHAKQAVALLACGRSPGEPPKPTTYGELDQRASQLAAQLRQFGIRPGDFVAVLMDRSVEMIVSLLGILKAGGAYVPLDPTYPQDRLNFMLGDTRAAVCLTQAHLVDRVRLTGAKAVVVGPDGLTDSAEAPPPFGHLGSSDPAYVIYTSGSTGRPKGVLVPHRGIVRLVTGQSYARLDDSRVILHLAPASFDAATFEIWGALLNGGRCVLAPDAGVPDLTRLGQVIAETGVTTLWLTASLFNLIVEQAPTVLETVEEVLVGGEALSVPHVRKALDLLPRVQFINGYGPTESTTFACCYRIPRPLPDDWRSIPIGPPIAHTSVFLLAENLRPVGAGEPGDLFIGGDGLALGYLNQPELTAERFPPNPFSTDGSRLYRTGDRARMLPDGALEFLGREDDQVKVRGHRVEPGEIEVVLRGHPSVSSAVVAVREDVPGEKRLVAYYTGNGGDGTSAADLRGWIGERLPDYMVPSHFVRIERIPLTPNGKADRSALPPPGRRRPVLGQQMVAPRTAVEAWVAGHWRDLLELDEVGVHDRFFELGGTSLAAMRLLGRLNQETRSPLSALLLFRAPTVARMADILEREHRAVLPLAVLAKVATQVPAAESDPSAERAARRRDELRERRLRRRHAS